MPYLAEVYRWDEVMPYYNKQANPSNIFFNIFCNIISITYTINKFNNVTIYWLALYVKVTNLSFVSERMHAAERSQLRRLLQLSSDDSNRQRGIAKSYRSLPPRHIRRMLTQRRCRSVAVHRRWCRLLWALTTLDDDGLTDLVTSFWLERTSCQFPVTFLL